LKLKDFKSKVPAKSLIESAYEYELKAKEFLFEGLGIADMAHVAMLMKTGIITKSIGKSILKKLLNFQNVQISKLHFDPSRGDIYTNREYFLCKKLGKLNNYIHTGRARREATNIAFLIACRDRIAQLGLSLGNLCKTLLKLTCQHKSTYMTDFTYLQHAHPTTLGHYLSGYLYPLIRDLKRLKDIYSKINQSPAGSGSVNGSQLPLDRKYLKSLMEFDDIIVHTRDAMWRHDVIIESTLPLLTTLTTISRFSEELIIWNTLEFSFVRLSPLHIRKSIIMPQKKNPYSLAFIRGLSRNMIGRFVSIASTGSTTSGQPDNRIFVYYDLPDCIGETKKAIELFNDVLTHCEFNKKRLLNSATEGFTIATDIVDYLISQYSIDNRTAYNIVGRTAEKVYSKQSNKITPELIYNSAKELGINLPKVHDKMFYENFQIENLIEKRKGIGGASTKSIDLMIRECEGVIRETMKFFNQKKPEILKKKFYSKIRRLVKKV
jgi:argininosuccinate lyase